MQTRIFDGETGPPGQFDRCHVGHGVELLRAAENEDAEDAQPGHQRQHDDVTALAADTHGCGQSLRTATGSRSEDGLSQFTLTVECCVHRLRALFATMVHGEPSWSSSVVD